MKCLYWFGARRGRKEERSTRRSGEEGPSPSFLIVSSVPWLLLPLSERLNQLELFLLQQRPLNLTRNVSLPPKFPDGLVVVLDQTAVSSRTLETSNDALSSSRLPLTFPSHLSDLPSMLLPQDSSFDPLLVSVYQDPPLRPSIDRKDDSRSRAQTDLELKVPRFLFSSCSH